MGTPKAVGIREFRENLASHLESSSPVAITRHGETIGFYIPVKRRRRDPEDFASFDQAAARLDAELARKGVTEDELVEEFKRRRAHKRK